LKIKTIKKLNFIRLYPLAPGQINWDYVWNGMWMGIIIITTGNLLYFKFLIFKNLFLNNLVGYGDFYAQTLIGRFFGFFLYGFFINDFFIFKVFIVCCLGPFLISLVNVTIINLTTFTIQEKNVKKEKTKKKFMERGQNKII
jgi:hypothetical protein